MLLFRWRWQSTGKSVCQFSGKDFPDLHVIHYGVPSTIDSHVQESGHCGRDGMQSYAIVLRHSHSLRGEHITEEIKAFVNTTFCRRQILMECFGFQAQCCAQQLL